jgi:ComF family protein
MVLTSSCVGCHEPGAVLCRRCRFALAATSPYHTAAGVAAVGRYEGLLRDLVVALKFRNRRRVAQVLAEHLVRRLRPTADLVTWAPTSPRRIGRRGYDQAELLARCVARELGVPCRRLLYRAHGVAHTGLSRQQRLHSGVAFRARRGRGSPRVLVVDDVVTTGASLQAALQALRGAGVADVRLMALAAAPAPVGFGPA